MWGLKISVLNSRMLQEYHICYDIPFTDTDMCMVYNARCHYSMAGTFSHKVSCIANFTVPSLGQNVGHITWSDSQSPH